MFHKMFHPTGCLQRIEFTAQYFDIQSFNSGIKICSDSFQTEFNHCATFPHAVFVLINAHARKTNFSRCILFENWVQPSKTNLQTADFN